jgi:hypothetical protein
VVLLVYVVWEVLRNGIVGFVEKGSGVRDKSLNSEKAKNRGIGRLRKCVVLRNY